VELKFSLFFTATLLFGIVAIIVFPQLTLAPGTMSKGHEFLKNDCTGCHAIPGGPVSRKCTACHQIEKIGLAPATSDTGFKPNQLTNRLHRHLGGLDCLRCHLEHSGRSKQLAGNFFSHSMIGAGGKVMCSVCHDFQEPRDELHTTATNECITCHETESWKMAKFDHNMLVDQKSKCAWCHGKVKPDDQMHHSFEGENSCEICHTTKEWKPSTFKHDQYFVFDSNHPDTCLNCHKAEDDHKTYTCFNCHAHNEEAIKKRHKDEGVLFFENCMKCHRSGNKYGKDELRIKEREQWKEGMKWAE